MIILCPFAQKQVAGYIFLDEIQEQKRLRRKTANIPQTRRCFPTICVVEDCRCALVEITTNLYGHQLPLIDCYPF